MADYCKNAKTNCSRKNVVRSSTIGGSLSPEMYSLSNNETEPTLIKAISCKGAVIKVL